MKYGETRSEKFTDLVSKSAVAAVSELMTMTSKPESST
jgi:hypothetical protein